MIFLVRYGAGRSAFNEEKKPVHFVSIGEIEKYKITFSQHIFILKNRADHVLKEFEQTIKFFIILSCILFYNWSKYLWSNG